MFWFLLWFVLSAIIIGATMWSSVILLRQKKAWAAYAARNKMTFDKGTFLGPATVEGFINGYRVSFFTAQRQTPDPRNRRYVTVMELRPPTGYVDGAAAGTPEMVAYLNTLTTLHPLAVESDKWDKANRLYVRNDDAIRAFLTPERLDHLNRILTTKNADVIVVFDEREAVIRLETPDPILEEQKMDKIVRRLIAHAEGMKVAEVPTL